MTKFELERFPDRRTKLLVRFQQTTNFRIDAETGEATWVPTLEEEEKLNEFLGMVDFHNVTKRKHNHIDDCNVMKQQSL